MTRKRRRIPNEYAEAISTYKKIPKAVLAAVAYAFAGRLYEDDPATIECAIVAEWTTLAANGIVPQKRIPRVDHMRQRELFPQERTAVYGR